ncbi:hypothetical protein [Isoalcanivorax indicus]|uniref:hypothetical protein n=1 Tax=Isoalcanivorax indicus TaxID=2202653 RepID=UPI0013C435BD|nr:hypothetical protein [Isoalcanivorax indicus]
MTYPVLSAANALVGDGMTLLMDEELAEVDGAGITFTWEDFRWLTQPTSYFEQIGSGTDPDTNWQRGDLRWYGVSVSAVGPGYTWTESGGNMDPCNGQGANGLGCPRGNTISHFAAHDNPYVLRVQDYSGLGAAAGDIGNGIITWSGSTSEAHTVLELLAPTRQEDYRFAFWGEIEVGRNPDTLANNGLLKSQTIIQGSAANSVLRLFQFTEPGNETLALMYHSHLQGDFRFSMAQTAASASDQLGIPVAFEPHEGLHFRNVDAYVPLGQLFYQALVLNVPRDAEGNTINDGNFILEIPKLPEDQPAVWRRFYSLAVPDAPDAGYITARAALLHHTPGATPATAVPDNYFVTHGYSRWGNWFPCQGVGCPNPPTSVNATRNAYNAIDSGIFFRAREGQTFDAYAYRLTAVDVRPGTFEYTCPSHTGSGCSGGSGGAYTPAGSGHGQTGRYYVGSASCTPGTTGNARFNCGYGGAFSISAAITNVSRVNPAHYFGHAPAAAHSQPVIRTNTANLGDSRIEGMLINHIRFTSYGANL